MDRVSCYDQKLLLDAPNGFILGPLSTERRRKFAAERRSMKEAVRSREAIVEGFNSKKLSNVKCEMPCLGERGHFPLLDSFPRLKIMRYCHCKFCFSTNSKNWSYWLSLRLTWAPLTLISIQCRSKPVFPYAAWFKIDVQKGSDLRHNEMIFHIRGLCPHGWRVSEL